MEQRAGDYRPHHLRTVMGSARLLAMGYLIQTEIQADSASIAVPATVKPYHGRRLCVSLFGGDPPRILNNTPLTGRQQEHHPDWICHASGHRQHPPARTNCQREGRGRIWDFAPPVDGRHSRRLCDRRGRVCEAKQCLLDAEPGEHFHGDWVCLALDSDGLGRPCTEAVGTRSNSGVWNRVESLYNHVSYDYAG